MDRKSNDILTDADRVITYYYNSKATEK